MRPASLRLQVGSKACHMPTTAIWIRCWRQGTLAFACHCVAFIFTTLYAIGRVAERDLARAWLLLSLALFVILV